MSMTLKLVDRLMTKARTLQAVGQTRDAYLILKQVSGFQGLSRPLAGEVRVRMADILTLHGRHKAARRHLLVAQAFHPTSARNHYLLGLAGLRDPRGDLSRAARHLLAALRLDPTMTAALEALGEVAMKMKRPVLAVKAYRRACKLAPADAGCLEGLVNAFRAAGRPEAARRALRLARFGMARNARFVKLFDDARFQDARAAQQGHDEPAVLKLFPAPTPRPAVRFDIAQRPAPRMPFFARRHKNVP